MQQKSKALTAIWKYAAITAGAFIYAAGFRFFLFVNDIPTGGLTGVAMIINRLTKLPVGTMTAVLNIPLFLAAWFGGGASNQFLLRQFLMGIPKALDEAAYIDGAGYFRIFISIVLPLCKSALVVVGMFSFLFYWNDFFSPMIYLENYKNYTIALGLQSFVSQHSSQWMLLMGAVTIGVLPAIVVFLIGQKYLLEGIALTGIKG